MQLILASILLSLLGPSLGATVARRQGGRTIPITLDIANGKVAPDGITRSAVLANGTYPGPLITATKGDKLSVTVHNRLTDPTMRRSTSANFDGIFTSAANVFNEGSPFVTTCPIAPGASYTYEVDLTDQAGSFWYHSQLDLQYLDGFRGPLIVYDPEDPLAHLYDVDDESTILQLGDWWQLTTLTVLPNYTATGIIPVSDSMTINGVARANNGPALPWPVINVVKGKRYRLRLISEAARNVINISVDNHPLTIIEADGVETEPHQVNVVPMLAGMRYSVVLNANQDVDNYWINGPFVGGNAAANPNQNATLTRAILRYKGAPDADPTAPYAPQTDGALVEADLRPLVPEPVPDPDVTIVLNLVVTAGKAQWNVNNVSYLSPKVPTLNQVLDGASNPGDFNITENTFVLPAQSTVEIQFPETDDDDAHPLHLHGNNFWLTKPMDAAAPNTVNPIKRDIGGVGGTGTNLRFTTDKPGPWFFHCHIFWHMHAGLATVMLADPAGVRQDAKPTPAWEALCPAYNALPADMQ